MKFTDILYEKKEGIARITINRPEVNNALRANTFEELTAAFEETAEDDEVGVVVLTGAGSRAFSAGGDLKFFKDVTDMKKGQRLFNILMRLGAAMRNNGKPVLARVNGFCVGAGNELNCACDLTIASDKSQFGQTGPKVGGCPVWYGTQMLPRLVGDKRAKEIVWICILYSAQEALQMGWINCVVPEEKLDEEVDKWCQQLLDRSPQSIRLSKFNINFESDLLYTSLLHGGEMVSYYLVSDESKEGMKAFVEKRKPNFRKFRKGL